MDATGTYVFEVDGRGVEQRLSKESPYWSVKNGNDTMVAFWNPAGSAEDVMVTLKYVGGSGVYHFRVHLGPHATGNLDLKELIANQSPDEDGNTLPINLQEGSFVFHNARDVHAPLALNINVGIYNVTKGTCYYGTVECAGYYGNLIVSPSSSSLSADGGQAMLQAYGQYSDGSQPGVYASFSSSNSSIASFSGQYVTATNTAGTATITASASLPEEGSYSGYNPSCSSLQPYVTFTGTATVSVGDNSPVITGISPSDWSAGSTTPVTISGQYFGTNAPALGFSPGSGISYALTGYSDTQITANVNVAAGTPPTCCSTQETLRRHPRLLPLLSGKIRTTIACSMISGRRPAEPFRSGTRRIRAPQESSLIGRAQQPNPAHTRAPVHPPLGRRISLHRDDWAQRDRR